MTRLLPPLAAALLLAAATAAAFIPMPAAVAPVVWIAVWGLPGLALAPRLRRGSLGDGALIVLAAGPLLFGAGFCAGRLLGLPVPLASLVPVWGGGLAVVLRELRPPGHAALPGVDDPRDPRESRWWIPALVIAAALLLAAWPPLLQEAMRIRDDARLHLPLARTLLQGSFPPENPFLAGEPVAYFWFYHTLLAGTASLVPAPLEFLPVALNLVSLGALLLALDRTGRALGLGPAVRAFGLAVAVFGLSPQGWMRLAWMHWSEAEMNWPLFRAAGSSALFPVLGAGDPRLAAFLTKVAMTNALPLGLAWALTALHPVLPGRRGAILRGLLVAGTLAVHLVTGILLVAGLVFREILLLGGLRGPALRSGTPFAPAMTLPLAGALLVTAPYVIGILAARTGGGASTFLWQPMRALELLAALAGVAILALPALPGWLRDPDRRFHLLAGLPALGLPFVLHLVDGNEYKSVLFLLPLLALPAAAGASRWVRGRAVLLPLLILPFLPNAWLTARTYATEVPPGLVIGEGRDRLGRLTAEAPEEIVLWKIDPGRGYSSLTLDLGRSSYLSDPYALQILGQWDGPAARLRRGELAAAREGKAAVALAGARRAMAPRPVWVVVSVSDLSRFPSLSRDLAGAGYREHARDAGVTLLAPPGEGNTP